MTSLDLRATAAMAGPRRLALAFAVLFAGLLLAACDELSGPPAVNPPVSEAPLELGETISPAVAPSIVAIFYGEGSCAPLFENGMQGTCINNTPCNGFGFEDEQGGLQCACFTTKGGCEAGSICSMRARGCTAEADADFKRTPLP